MEKLYVIWYACLGEGLSGGDNILIELCRRWKLNITIFTGKEGKRMGESLAASFKICPSHRFFRYVERLYYTLKTAFTFKDQDCIVYTASDFPHDLLVGWIIKLRFPQVRWVAGYYLVICPVLAPNNPYKGCNMVKGILYRSLQCVTLRIVNKWADLVYVTSEPERKHFTKPTVVIKGGVDIKKIDFYLHNENKVFIPFKNAKYDAVFVGRLHYQKGILELMEIWKKVNETLPLSKLLVIGDGPLREKAEKIAPSTVTFVGFQKDKFSLLCDSKIILHPATYDSGGMACAEGMALGLPAVGFDLEVFKTYYPYGMLKAKTKDEFAKYIISLLTDETLYYQTSIDARSLIVNHWDWEKRSKEIYDETKRILLS